MRLLFNHDTSAIARSIGCIETEDIVETASLLEKLKTIEYTSIEQGMQTLSFPSSTQGNQTLPFPSSTQGNQTQPFPSSTQGMQTQPISPSTRGVQTEAFALTDHSIHTRPIDPVHQVMQIQSLHSPPQNIYTQALAPTENVIQTLPVGPVQQAMQTRPQIHTAQGVQSSSTNRTNTHNTECVTVQPTHIRAPSSAHVDNGGLFDDNWLFDIGGPFDTSEHMVSTQVQPPSRAAPVSPFLFINDSPPRTRTQPSRTTSVPPILTINYEPSSRAQTQPPPQVTNADMAAPATVETRGKHKKIKTSVHMDTVLFVGVDDAEEAIYKPIEHASAELQAHLKDAIHAAYCSEPKNKKAFENVMRHSEDSMLRNKCVNMRLFGRKYTLQEDDVLACKICCRTCRPCARVIDDGHSHKLCIFPLPGVMGLTWEDKGFWLNA
jgi:hypothetical protein